MATLNRRMTLWTSIGLIGLASMNAAGCGDKDKRASDVDDSTPSQRSNSAQSTPNADRPANPDPARRSDEPYSTPPNVQQTDETDQPTATPTQDAAPSTQAAIVPTPVAPEPSPVDDGRENQRQQVVDAIYAQIRLQMEQAIVERKQLLDAGTPASDEKVRNLEGKIMKARELLIENGEEVEEVDPPIVQRNP